MRADSGQEIGNGSTTEATLRKDGGPGAHQGVRVQERDGGAEAGQDFGQRRLGRSAPKRIAASKLREGMAIGCMVTLRGDRMYEFFDRLVNVALPRVRDFRGVSSKSFDGRGNYTLG